MSVSHFLRERAKGVADNIVASLLYAGGSLGIGWLANYVALYFGLGQRMALVIGWTLGLLIAVVLILLLKPKSESATEAKATPQQQFSHTGIINAPHNEFNPTLIVNVPVSQTQQQAKRESEQVSAARQALAKQPVLEYKGSRLIKRPIDLENNTLGDRDYEDRELGQGFRNVIVALAKFYYRPDVGVDPWLSVRAHIEFRDEDGYVAAAVDDAMWHKEDDKYKEFNTGDSHYLIVALIPIGSKDMVLTYEHNLESHDGVFTKTGGFVTERLVPEIRNIQGKEFKFSVELIGKRLNQVIVTKKFNFRLTLTPEAKLEEVRSDLENSLSGDQSKAQLNRGRVREELLPLLREGQQLESELPNALHDRTRTLYSRCLGWGERVERTLRLYLDESFVVRFQASDEQSGDSWPTQLRGRVAELEKIVKDLSD